MKKKTYLLSKQDLPAIRQEEEDDPDDISFSPQFMLKNPSCLNCDEEEDCNQSLSTLPDNSAQVRTLNGAQTAALYCYMQYRPREKTNCQAVKPSSNPKVKSSWVSSHFVLIIAVCLCSVMLALLAYALFIYENYPVAENITAASVSNKKITYQNKQVLINEVPPFYLAVSALDNPFQHTQKAQAVATLIQSTCFLLVPFFFNLVFLYRNLRRIFLHLSQTRTPQISENLQFKLHRSLRHPPKANSVKGKQTSKTGKASEEGSSCWKENTPLLVLIFLMNITMLAQVQTGRFQWAWSSIYCTIYCASVSFQAIQRFSSNKIVRKVAGLSHMVFCGASIGIVVTIGSGLLQYT